ncbi:putative nuclease HARBI1 [Pseudophryne corroboree]|uniref:putative nuclease HARBI1 n=1 Tax=Pseudophryne corroboree TaxID=495146 RepID=UPI0030819EB4
MNAQPNSIMNTSLNSTTPAQIMPLSIRILRVDLSIILARENCRSSASSKRHLVNGNRLRISRIFLKMKKFAGLRESKVIKRYRLPSTAILGLYSKIRQELTPKTKRSRAITGITKLLATLHFLASGTFQSTVSDVGGISQSAFSCFFKKVLDAILKHTQEYIYFPINSSENIQIKKDFYDIARFPNVIGAIDCTDINFTPSHNMDEICRNRKNFHSMNMQVVCDSKSRILNVFAVFPGGTHDSYILCHSALFERFENNEMCDGWLLGDSGYGCRPWLLTPFSKPKGRAKKNTTDLIYQLAQ